MPREALLALLLLLLEVVVELLLEEVFVELLVLLVEVLVLVAVDPVPDLPPWLWRARWSGPAFSSGLSPWLCYRVPLVGLPSLCP